MERQQRRNDRKGRDSHGGGSWERKEPTVTWIFAKTKSKSSVFEIKAQADKPQLLFRGVDHDDDTEFWPLDEMKKCLESLGVVASMELDDNDQRQY